MRKIPDSSVHMILCDLPYGTTACSWDSVIPFEPLWKEYRRIIIDYGAIVLFGAEPFSSALRTSNIKWYKYDWIWQKSSNVGFTNAKNKPLNDHELVSVFSKGTTANCSDKMMPYYPQGLIRVNKITSGLKGASSSDEKGHRFMRKSDKEKILQEYANYPKKIIRFGNDSNTVHPTQKPVALLEYLIKTYTNVGDIVMDNTMGSGSTGVAAVKCKRKFIGIEKELEYYNVAGRRIKEITHSLF